MWLNVTILVICTHYVCNSHYHCSYIYKITDLQKQIRDLLNCSICSCVIWKNKNKRSGERGGKKSRCAKSDAFGCIIKYVSWIRDCYWWPASGTQGPILFTNNPKKRKYKIKKKQQVYNECFLEQYKGPIGYLFCVYKGKVNKVERGAYTGFTVCTEFYCFLPN